MASSDVATSTISNNPARRRVTSDLCAWSLRCGISMTSALHGKTADEHLYQRLFQASLRALRWQLPAPKSLTASDVARYHAGRLAPTCRSGVPVPHGGD